MTQRRRVLTRGFLAALAGAPFNIASCEPRQDEEIERLSGPLCGGLGVEIRDEFVGCPCELAGRCRFMPPRDGQ